MSRWWGSRTIVRWHNVMFFFCLGMCIRVCLLKSVLRTPDYKSGWVNFKLVQCVPLV